MIRSLLIARLLLASPAAFAQQSSVPLHGMQQPSPIREAVDESYALGLRTGQALSEMQRQSDDRLKWVLDNWVPKQPEIEPNAKPAEK